MKITRKQLEENIRKFLNEAAPDGYIQRKYRKTFRNMIAKASSGGNKNTPPYSNPATMLDSDVSGKHSKVGKRKK